MFKQNEAVKYTCGSFCGEGIIVGICAIEQPVIGANYIIQDLSENFPNDVYPYSHISCSECWLTKV